MRYFFLSRLLLLFLLIGCFSCSKESAPRIEGTKETFIAHGGGAIQGFFYTNSLEALDLSYKKGCRMFELDMILTSDGKYVAAHDWYNFKKTTTYEGAIDDTPLTEAQFLSYKLYRQFTPMNMDRINDWFGKHPDAWLVTDKARSPAAFSQLFHYKDRLIMDVFNWSEAKEAIAAGVLPMPSENMITDKPDELADRLAALNIKQIATAADNVSGYRSLLTQLTQQGVKVFVYDLVNVNLNESEFLKQNTDCVFGVYADNFDVIK